MAATQKVQGPASYFPSIEKKYGQRVEHWFSTRCKVLTTIIIAISRRSAMYPVNLPSRCGVRRRRGSR